MHPVLFRLGTLVVHSYTVCLVAAVLLGGYLTYREALRRGRLTENTLLVGSLGLVGGVAGAKLSMLIFLGPQTFWRVLPTLPEHGAAWTGALFGGYVTVVVAERLLGVDRCTGDLAAPFIPLAQAIGRLGNLLGGDPFGLPSTLPWAIVQHGVRRQPTAAYELLLDLALFVVLLRLRGKLPHAGDLFSLYIVGYCSLRFLLDFTRADPHVLFGLTMVQVLYAVAIPSFGYKLWASYRRLRRERAAATPVAPAAAEAA